MGIFGPRYPAKLQQVVNHAERFAMVLSDLQVRGGVQDDRALAWLAGRTEELEAVLTCTIEDWRAGALTEEAATDAASAYLRELHAGAEEHLKLGALQCCRAEVESTADRVPLEALTQRVPMPESAPGDTVVDPVLSARLIEEARRK